MKEANLVDCSSSLFSSTENFISELTSRENAVVRGGIKLTVQGRNMDVVLNPRMVVTVTIRRDRRGRQTGSNSDDNDSDDDDDDDEEIIRYPPSVCLA